MNTRMVKVLGGHRDDRGTFIVERSRVVRENELAALFRQDDRLRGMPVIQLMNL